MQIARLKLSQNFNYMDYIISNETMCIIAWFLASDIGCPPTTYEDWILNDSLGMYVSGNLIALEKDGDNVYLTNMYEESQNPTVLTISRKDLIQLLNDWNEKVCKKMPQEVIIKYENNIFSIETSE